MCSHLSWVLLYLCTSSVHHSWLFLTFCVIIRHVSSSLPFFFSSLFFLAASHLCLLVLSSSPAPVITRLSASALHLCVIVSLSLPLPFVLERPASSLVRSRSRHTIYSLASVMFSPPPCFSHFGRIAFLFTDPPAFHGLTRPTACWPPVASTVFNLLNPSRSLCCRPRSLLPWIIKMCVSDAVLHHKINGQNKKK